MFSLSPVMADTLFVHSPAVTTAKMVTPIAFLIDTFFESGEKWIGLMNVDSEKNDIVLSKVPLFFTGGKNDPDHHIACSNYVVGGKYGAAKKIEILLLDMQFNQADAFKCFCKINPSVLEGHFYSDGEFSYACEAGQVITKKHVVKKESVVAPITL